MKTLFSLSHPVVAVGSPTLVDLLLSFQSDASAGQAARRPLNLSVVIDRSGSMAGAPLKHAIKAAQDLVDRLTPADLLSVVIYDDDVETLLPPQPVQDRAAIKALIGKIRAGGCTNLSGGWLAGCEHVKKHQSPDRVNRVLLLTDGQANTGITAADVLIQTARRQADGGIVTTTLGFGSYFNEDLLIGMARAAEGNYYYIQSPDEAADVFRIELESLLTVAAQNLVVTVEPLQGAQLAGMLNTYRSSSPDGRLEVSLGDVYAIEPKLLALELSLPAREVTGPLEVARVSYRFHAVVEGAIEPGGGELIVTATYGTAEEAANRGLDAAVLEQTSRLRIARAKDEAIELADRGDLAGASSKLKKTIADLKLRTVHESFEVAEELDQLDHYAQKLESRRYDAAARKEMRDQAYQAQVRNRDDLKLRGISSGSADSLEAISDAGQAVLLRCERENGKLRVRVISDGYDRDLNVQFPRAIREEGVTYTAEEVKLSADGTFYRTGGVLRRLVLPGQERNAARAKASASSRASLKPVSNSLTAADLETTDTVGDGVLVQCVKEGSKLRARVVSDGYNPDWNMRFPRSIREEGVLYVVEDVREASNGGSYVAFGKIRRFVQA